MTTQMKTETKAQQPKVEHSLLQTQWHILIVEDPDMQDPISDLLLTLERNYRLNICATAEEACAYITQHKHSLDMIILNDCLQDARGIELLSLLKCHPKLEKIPLILYVKTVEGLKFDDLTKVALTMVNEYVTLLCDRETLTSLIGSLLEKRRV